MIPGYKLEKELDKTSSSVIYRGLKEDINTSYILKLPAKEKLSKEELNKFLYEYEIIKDLKIDGIFRAIGIETFPDNIAIVFEDFDAIPLKAFAGKYLSGSEVPVRPNLKMVLEIMINLSLVIEELHKNNIIHRNISPYNIFINPHTCQVKITDFSSASVFMNKEEDFAYPVLPKDNLLYISPEQTGRINKPVDFRSDFYSLGMTFYELITGFNPFQSDDAMEIIHFHIAKKPLPPDKINSSVPKAVAEIIMKLIAKNPEERYKSAYGLRMDLEVCLDKLNSTGVIEGFVTGKLDVSDIFKLSPSLYNREEEFSLLINTLKKVGSSHTEIVLLSGDEGIGKTSFIQEAQKLIARHKGYFISVSFDQFKRDMPYYSIIQGFHELLRRLLTENEARVQQWKDEIIQDLEHDLNDIIEVFPEIKFIVGSKYFSDSHGKQHARINYPEVFHKLIKVLAKKEHPFVILLDNLHFCDTASIRFISDIALEHKLKYLMLTGTYQETKLYDNYVFSQFLANLRAAGSHLNELSLQPLSIKDISRFLSDSFDSVSEQTNILAETIYEKTAGNPFYIHELLNTAYKYSYITFKPGYGWLWDIDEIAMLKTRENNIEFFTTKINKLSAAAIEVLKYASCLGNEFSFASLAAICGKDEMDTFMALSEAINEDMIIIMEDTNRFINDNVHKAAYLLIDDTERKAMHYRIGRIFLQNTPQDMLTENIFDIVNHLNLGKELISETGEIYELSHYNYLAGIKAKTASSPDLALKYFTQAVMILPENCWQINYEQVLELYLEKAEAEYLYGNRFEAESAFELMLSRADSDSDKVRIYKLSSLLYKGSGSKKVHAFNLPENLKASSETITNSDFKSVVKAFHSLSAEIILDNLIEKLMKIVIENAGAEKGYLILKNKEGLFIEAEGSLDSQQTRKSVSLDSYRDISHAIVNYVARTKEDLVLNDVVNEGLFISDPYVIKNQPRSVLCIPIIKQLKLVGILYLENNLSTGVFTADRLEVLKMLSSQAAISIENARLYDEMKELNVSLERHKNHLEEMVEERTTQLKETQEKLLDAAHKAGMAEIATGVLHNVGNILNSLGVSGEIIYKTLERSEINSLFQANDLLRKNKDDLSNFLTQNPKGTKLPRFYLSLDEILKEEFNNLMAETISLLEKISLTKNIVSTQQDYASTGFFNEKINMAELVENSLSIQLGSLIRHNIQVEKSFDNVPLIIAQKSKLLNILMNVIKNSKEAMNNNDISNRKLKINLTKDNEYLYLSITDNGSGISAEHLSKIFIHGFTTKKYGHGFGLHTCANAMTEMGGKLLAESAGPGKGACFTLLFPLVKAGSD